MVSIYFNTFQGVLKLHIFYLSCIAVLISFILYRNREFKQLKFMYDRISVINETMINISEELNRFQDIDQLYRQLLEETISIIDGAEVGSILIYNNEKDIMEYRAAYGFRLEDLQSVQLKKNELFLYEITKLKYPGIIKKPAVFDSLNIDKEKYSILDSTKALDIKSTLSSPLYVDGNFYGLINIDNKSDENAFTKKDIRLITYICKQLEIAIKNASLVNELVDALRIDKLTGIINRRYLEEILESRILKEWGQLFSFIMIDLDDFKCVNDAYGHRMGDEILRYFATILRKNIGKDDIAARFAGDEFVLLLNSPKDEAEAIIDNIRNDLLSCPYKGIRVEFSAGICECAEDMDMDRLLTIADDNMYANKRQRKELQGYNCVNV